MRYIQSEGDHLIFQLSRREKHLLLDLLTLYPVVPPAHAKLTVSPESAENRANQRLLEEALAEHRAENKRQLQALLAEPNRFRAGSSGFHLGLTSAEMEWLLQVLNDIRVGSWIQLGSPDEKQGKRLRIDPQTARFLWAMELAGHFQAALLTAAQSE